MTQNKLEEREISLTRRLLDVSCDPLKIHCNLKASCITLFCRWDEDPRNCRGYFGHSGGVNYHGTSCRHSYFKCRNDVGCVAPKFVCDGEDDCADGSDEWNCGSDRPTTCDSYKEFQVQLTVIILATRLC